MLANTTINLELEYQQNKKKTSWINFYIHLYISTIYMCPWLQKTTQVNKMQYSRVVNSLDVSENTGFYTT